MVCYLHDSTAILKPCSISSQTVPFMIVCCTFITVYAWGFCVVSSWSLTMQVDAAVLENLRGMFFDGVKAQFQVSSVSVGSLSQALFCIRAAAEL